MESGTLLAIFYAEFDAVAGPVLTFQFPKSFMSKDTFDSIAEYMITKHELYDKVVTLTAHEKQIMGYPVCIKDPKYPRNQFLFNFAFVFGWARSFFQNTREYRRNSEVAPYEAVLEKLANTFRTLEMEKEFLFRAESKRRVRGMIQKIYQELNEGKHCLVHIGTYIQKEIEEMDVDGASVLTLRLFPQLPSPPEVKNHEVPVPLVNLCRFATDEWDLTLLQILPLIDGVRYIKRIAQEANVEVGLVKSCVRHLIYYKCVAVINIFQFSNVYRVTPHIRKLAEDGIMQERCVRFVTLESSSRSPSFPSIFRLYCALHSGTTLGDVVRQHEVHRQGINHRLFILFGLLNGIVKRVHQYPLWLPTPAGRGIISPSSSPSAAMIPRGKEKVPPLSKKMIPWLDGKHSMDAICCEMSMHRSSVMEMLFGRPDVVIISR